MIRQVNYNADSLAALNTRLEAADSVPVLGDVYTTLYKNVIDNLEYGYSTGDQQKMNDEAAKLSAKTGSIIDQFKATEQRVFRGQKNTLRTGRTHRRGQKARRR